MLLLALNIGNEYFKIYIKMSENCFHRISSDIWILSMIPILPYICLPWPRVTLTTIIWTLQRWNSNWKFWRKAWHKCDIHMTSHLYLSPLPHLQLIAKRNHNAAFIIWYINYCILIHCFITNIPLGFMDVMIVRTRH